ncbi:MAG: zinc ribbon domain-containing protein [Asticcacaulis sp.]
MRWDILTLARGAKTVAVLGFILPWLVVSCSGQKVVEGNGLGLAFGHLKIMGDTGGAQHQHPELLVLLALLILAASLGWGMFNARSAKDAQAPQDRKTQAKVTLAGAAASLALLCLFGFGVGGEIKRGIAQSNGGGGYNSMGEAAAAAFQVRMEFGYWLTLAALASAAGLGFAVVTGREEQLVESLPQSLSSLGLAPKGPADDDLGFWDSMTDKNDPDLLQEYIFRHPHGRFVDLARMRLEAKGMKPVQPTEAVSEPAPEKAAEAAPEAAASDKAPFCAQCSARLADGAKFCTECGAEAGTR